MGGEGEGSVVKGGGKWGLGTPLSTPSLKTPNTFIFISTGCHPFIYPSLLLIFLTNTPDAHTILIILERGFRIMKKEIHVEQ